MSDKQRILTINLPRGVQRFLQQNWGDRCEFLTAANALEAGQIIGRERPDAVLADAELPSLSTADLVDGLASGAGGVAVAVFSRETANPVAAQCRAAGAALVVDPDTTRATVAEWFEALVQQPAASVPPALSSDMATSITTATTDVVAGLLGIEAQFGELRIEPAGTRSADVIGSIGVAGFVTGGITVFLSMTLAKVIAGRMLADPSPADIDIVDAVGELTNMIAGNIKTCLCRTEEMFSMAPPTVIIGSEVRRMSLDHKLAFVLPCSLQGEQLLVEFNLVPKRRCLAPTPSPQLLHPLPD